MSILPAGSESYLLAVVSSHTNLADPRGEQRSSHHSAQVRKIEEDLRKARDSLEERVAERTAELQQAMDKVKVLRGLLPICSSCKKIRDDQGYWTQLETYIHRHSEAEFTHGLCPNCAEALFQDYIEKFS